MATTEEQKAIYYVLEALHAKGDEWSRRESVKSSHAVKAARSKFESIHVNDLSTLLQHGGRVGSFRENEVVYLAPPKKEDSAAAALWCRWDYEKTPPECGFYFGLWSSYRAFPKPEPEREHERHIAFLGYRFETPEEDENHNYYHAQPCRSMGRRDDEIEFALPGSNRMPTWPIAAGCALDLLLCLITSIYGMNGLKSIHNTLFDQPAPRSNARLRASFETIFRLCIPKEAQNVSVASDGASKLDGCDC